MKLYFMFPIYKIIKIKRFLKAVFIFYSRLKLNECKEALDKNLPK